MIRNCAKQSAGFSFIEILISLFILSLGLLGITELTLVSLKNVQNTYWRSIAVTQIVSMAERLRVNFSDQKNECELWRQENLHLLPESKSTCSCSSSHCQLTLQWQQQRLSFQISL